MAKSSTVDYSAGTGSIARSTYRTTLIPLFIYHFVRCQSVEERDGKTVEGGLPTEE